MAFSLQLFFIHYVYYTRKVYKHEYMYEVRPPPLPLPYKIVGTPLTSRGIGIFPNKYCRLGRSGKHWRVSDLFRNYERGLATTYGGRSITLDTKLSQNFRETIKDTMKLIYRATHTAIFIH